MFRVALLCCATAATAAAAALDARSVPQSPLRQPSPADTRATLSDNALRHQGFRLIATNEHAPPVWMHAGDILNLYQTETRFIDVTDQDLESLVAMPSPTKFAIPNKPRHLPIVNSLLKDISIPLMTEWLTKFTSFKTRYYQSPSGLASAEWLFEQASSIAQKADPEKLKITVSKFEHDWAQFSIIVRLDSVNGTRGVPIPDDEPVVIISAHQDSTNQWNPWWGAAPGADDDGSGSCTIFEAYRVLVESGFVPSRPIEFHWYSAEEAGLLGSQKVVAKYKSNGINVAGVFHADMTGYTPENAQEVIAVSTDNVDEVLEDFVRSLIEVYNSGVKIIETECGYGCSDHASWTKAGYRASFTFETAFKSSSPYIHSTNDVVEHITFTHVEKFTRIAIAFAVEMSYDRSSL
ncbi:Leucine aminopeptidase 1 [Entophlyctis luteolus]|nr:Leucine aminopeptidase 1 [Entophlyctis luteolus]